MNASLLWDQLISGLSLGALYGLIAIGYSLVYGIIGLINFAHGDIYMISAFLTAIGIALANLFGVPIGALTLVVVLGFSVLITGLYGLAVERLAYKPLRDAPRLAPLISAIGMSLVLQNGVRLAQGARAQGVPTLISGQWSWQGFDLSYVQGLILLVSAISAIVLSSVIRYTRLGRSMRATQQDPLMASLLGVNVERIIPLVFMIGAMMAAIAGFLVTLYYGSFDFFIGFITGMKAFTAAVLGGIGSLPGALLGGLLLGLSESLFAGFISVDYKDVFAFAVLILVLVFKPSGLLGTPDVEKV